MRNALFHAACASIALLTGPTAATAATQLGERFTFSGFGTVGAVQTNSDEGRFGRDRQPGGADKSASPDVDSNLGLQLTGTATSWLSGTVQLLAAKRDKGHVEPDVEWAYALVKPIEGLSVRLGRMALPTFAISDSRNIGYANNWIRPPNEVYALNLFRSLKGGDITYRTALGPVGLSAALIAGKSEFSNSGTLARGDKLRAVNLQIETEWATFRYGRMTVDVHVTPKPDPYTFSGFGVIVDRNDLVFQAESVRRRSADFGAAVDSDGWYAMGGYRFGTVLPYAIVSGTKPKDKSFPVHQSGTQKTTAVGVRWDAFASAALKFQLDRIDTRGTTGISFTTPALATPPGVPPIYAPLTRPVTAVSVAVDFVF